MGDGAEHADLGVNELSLRLPSILLSTFAIVLTYAIGSMLFSSPVGLVAAFLHAVNGLIIQVTAGRVATDHIDLFHLFFVELSVYFALLHARTGKRLITPLVGLSVGLAILCKWLTALIALPLWFIMARTRDRPPVCCAQCLDYRRRLRRDVPPLAVLCTRHLPAGGEMGELLNIRHITEALDGHGGTWSFYVRGLVHYGEFIALPIVWFLVHTARNWRETRFLMPTVWFVVPFAFFPS